MKDSFKKFVHEFVENAQTKIIELAKTGLANEEKKKQLDETMILFVTTILDKAKINGLVRLLIKKLVIPCIDDVTQVIYDLLKAKIKEAEQKQAEKDKTEEQTKQAENDKNKEKQKGGNG